MKRWCCNWVLLVGAIALLSSCGYAEPGEVTWMGQPDKIISMKLARGGFEIHWLPATLAPNTNPKALVIFGSGGGGWTIWEDRICARLQGDGYDVVGVDMWGFAGCEMPWTKVCDDYLNFVKKGQELGGRQGQIPIIYGGWSTGAEEAVAAAAGQRPPGLVGLLMIAPGNEGYTGHYMKDMIKVNVPEGFVFTLAGLADKLTGLKVIFCHGQLDVLDSRSWFSSVSVPKKEIDYQKLGHIYGNCCDKFTKSVIRELPWLYEDQQVVVPDDESQDDE